MQNALSFESAPPFAAPLRFFLTAPLFAVLAGVLILAEGPTLFASRWTPGALAATHLLTVGFMLQIMLGALIQVLPVVAGANLARPLAVATGVHAGLTLGGLALAGGLYFSFPDGLVAAAVLLGFSVLGFLVATVRALIGLPSSSPTVLGLKLSLLGLLGVAGTGLVLALSLAWGWAVPLIDLANFHAAWGLGAWAGILLAAVAFVVVPMFQLTPGYPARPAWGLPSLVMFALLWWTAGFWQDWPLAVRSALALLALGGLAFAGMTLRLQAKRRRARVDATARYWQGGLALAIFGLFFVLTTAIRPDAVAHDSVPLLVGVLLLVGAFMSFINGMLYKILPFLAWLHLQNSTLPGLAVPTMNKLLADGAMQGQMKVHALAVILLIGAVFFPDMLARPAGLVLALASGSLWWNLFGVVRRYRAHLHLVAMKTAAL